MIEKNAYHQIENTVESEFSTYIYNNNSSTFNHPHFHQNLEMLIVIDGSCRYTVGNQNFDLRSGDGILILPFQVHHFTIGANSSVRCLTFSELLILTLAKRFEKKKLNPPVFRLSENTTTYFLSSLSALFGEKCGPNPHLPVAMRLKLKGLLYLIGGEIIEQTTLVDMGSADMLEMDIVNYISDNYKNDISLHDIANIKGYNYQYLSRVFNKTFGINFKTMLNWYRANRALELLRDTSLSPTEIAFESGFQSIRSFNHVFINSFGKSPKEFRRNRIK